MRLPKVTTRTPSSIPSPIEVDRPITVTVPTACTLSGLGATTIWSLISDGTLQTVQVGRRRLVLYESLSHLLKPPADSAAVKSPTRSASRNRGKGESR